MKIPMTVLNNHYANAAVHMTPAFQYVLYVCICVQENDDVFVIVPSYNTPCNSGYYAADVIVVPIDAHQNIGRCCTCRVVRRFPDADLVIQRSIL